MYVVTSSPQAPASLAVPPAKARSFLLELVWAALRHDLDAGAVASAARAARVDDLDAALTDVVWFASLAVESDAPRRAKLADLARSLVEDSGAIQKSTLLERCEGEFLEEAGFLASASQFRKKEIRVNTRVVYTQKKFNLLREESEGYAKVLAVLAAFTDGAAERAGRARDDEGGTTRDDEGARAVRAVRALIGAFDLDPNRVLELVLEACELAPADDAPKFEALFRLFRAENVAQVLGFAFQNHAAETAREKEAARAASFSRAVSAAWFWNANPSTWATFSARNRRNSASNFGASSAGASSHASSTSSSTRFGSRSNAPIKARTARTARAPSSSRVVPPSSSRARPARSAAPSVNAARTARTLA